MWFWNSRLGSPPYYYNVFSVFYWDGQKIEKGTGQNVLAESDPLQVHVVPETDVHHHFQKLKSTSLYSLYCLTARTLWRQAVVWWITETETEQTQLLHQSSRLFLSSFGRNVHTMWKNVNDWSFFFTRYSFYNVTQKTLQRRRFQINGFL